MESTPTFSRLTQLTMTASASAQTEMTARFMQASASGEPGTALLEECGDALSEVLARVAGGNDVICLRGIETPSGTPMRRTTSLVARRVSGALAAMDCARSRTTLSRSPRIGHARHQSERRRLVDIEKPAGEQQVLGAGRPDEVNEPGEVRGRQAVTERSRDGDAELCAGVQTRRSQVNAMAQPPPAATP